jgi:hypothetical protein
MNNKLILAFCLIGFLTACTDVLDKAPDGGLSMNEVLSDPDKVEGLLNRCYENIPQKGYAYFFFDPLVVACSDDGWSSEDGAGQAVDQFYRGNASASYHPMTNFSGRHGGENNFDYWARYWPQIRLCSQFIEVIDKAAVKSEGNRARFKAEAHLLRAYFYSELVKWFGAVPILDATVPFDADFSTLRRNSVYDVAQFIAKDCDVAINTPELPWRITEASDAMRVTKALAHALKTKMLLFAASPLHNQGNNYWEEAYLAGQKAVNELKANGYELFKTCTEPGTFGTGPAAALHQLVCQPADYSASPRDKETIWQNRGGGVFVWHIGYVGSNMDGTYKVGTAPTQELIDAFETEDGVPVLDPARPYLDENHLQPNYATNSLYNPNDPYKHRDPRLYITALMNGDQFIWNNGEVITVEAFTGGKFAPSFDQTNRTQTRTGYFHSKMVTPGACNTRQINDSPWKFYRLGELLLDYAEAAAEANHLAEARAAANEVRARSGMPELPASLSQAELILRIHNERRVELAWEEHRYFDLRRWQKPDGDLSATSKWFTAMIITKNADGTFTYNRQNISTVPRGGWQNRDLLLPIPLNEASRLEPVTGEKWQNQGW